LSLASLLLAVAIFSSVLGIDDSWLLAFKTTMSFAFPVWLVNLPFLFLFKNVGRHRGWIIPAFGAFIGPACLMLWYSILVHRGDDNWPNLWRGDPENGGGLLGLFLIFAFLVGLGTNLFYWLAVNLQKTTRNTPHIARG
jgi:hypothetical protein